MRRLFTIALLLGLAVAAQAQQEPLYSQYLFNKLVLNPAYAGSREQLAIALQGRRQWAGFKGAPNTEVVNLHFPTPDLRHGLGFSLVNDRWGHTQTTLVAASYAYRIPVSEHGTFSMGLKAGIKSYRLQFEDVDLWTPNDIAFNNGNNFSKGLLVIAPGFYYQSDKFYGGLSVSDILPHKLYYPALTPTGGKTATHSFLMAGAALPIGASVKFKPSMLVRIVRGAPLGLDLTVAAAFKDRLTVGMTWRPGNAVAFLLQAYATKFIHLGYSYDLGTNATRTFATGGHELMLGFDLNFLQRDIPSPKPF